MALIKIKNMVNITNTSFEKLELPERICKYRDWDNDYHKRFITEREVFLASPSTFEDELDSKNPIRYDLLSKYKLRELYLHYSKKENISFNRKQHRDFTKDWVKKAMLRNKAYLDKTNEEFLKKYFEREGVLSLTKDPNNDAMWDKYANENKGFCIEYDPMIMFKYLGGGGSVIYVKELPQILPEPFMTLEEVMFQRVYTKLEKWSFEEEYRTRKFWNHPASIKERQIQIPKEAFKRIILGDNMSVQNKNYIEKETITHIGDVEIIERKNIT